MIDIVPLFIVLCVTAAVGVFFAVVGWYGYNRSGLRGVVITWLGGTAVGTIFIASGVAAPRGVQNLTEFVTALLVFAFIFGVGALVIVLWSFQQPDKTSAGLYPRGKNRFSFGLAISVSGTMLIAFILSLALLIIFTQHEL